jgi:hypothetical protein
MLKKLEDEVLVDEVLVNGVFLGMSKAVGFSF